MARSPDPKSDAAVATLREVQHATSHQLGQTLERVASQIGAHADVRTVFGEPVSAHGITVIPVARVVGGFGAGAGAGADHAEGPSAGAGMGAGGGFFASPVGFIEIDAKGARFREVEGPLGQWSGPAELLLRMLSGGVRALVSAVQKRAR